MKYKITNQYAQSSENLIAEFKDYADANFFIKRKLISDAEKSLKLIYRLFEDQDLQKEFKENIHPTSSIRAGDYAQGKYLPDSFGRYKVSNENLASKAHAGFVEKMDAELFVEDKLTHLNAITTYYIFDQDKMISELNQRVKKQADTSGGQGKGQAASFQPSPFNMTPRPAGMPPSWVRDKEDKKEDKK